MSNTYKFFKVVEENGELYGAVLKDTGLSDHAEVGALLRAEYPEMVVDGDRTVSAATLCGKEFMGLGYVSDYRSSLYMPSGDTVSYIAKDKEGYIFTVVDTDVERSLVFFSEDLDCKMIKRR